MRLRYALKLVCYSVLTIFQVSPSNNEGFSWEPSLDDLPAVDVRITRIDSDRLRHSQPALLDCEPTPTAIDSTPLPAASDLAGGAPVLRAVIRPLDIIKEGVTAVKEGNRINLRTLSAPRDKRGRPQSIDPDLERLKQNTSFLKNLLAAWLGVVPRDAARCKRQADGSSKLNSIKLAVLDSDTGSTETVFYKNHTKTKEPKNDGIYDLAGYLQRGFDAWEQVDLAEMDHDSLQILYQNVSELDDIVTAYRHDLDMYSISLPDDIAPHLAPRQLVFMAKAPNRQPKDISIRVGQSASKRYRFRSETSTKS